MSTILVVALVLAGVAVVLVIAFLLVARSLNFGAPLAEGEADETMKYFGIPECSHFEATGSMPLSTRVAQSAYRFHAAAYLHEGRAFPKTFEDGPWKWSERQRYAPRDFVSGHFFALDARGAEAEARYYKIDVKDRVLLEAELELDDVLDLRFEPNVRAVLAEVMREGPGSLVWWLRALVHEETGGNELTDAIGIWAQSKGYKGILFFGARAIAKYRSSFEGTADHQLGIPVVGGIFAELRDDPTATNLVVLSGVDLVRAIRRYRRDTEPWKTNEFFGVDASVVDLELKFTSVDRRERIESFIAVGGERTLSLEWDGRVEEQETPEKPTRGA